MRYTFITLLGIVSCAVALVANERAPNHVLKFPQVVESELGLIDRLPVSVHCGRISALRDIPELYNIEMGYDMPTENVLEARPRLGAAAVALRRWSGAFL